MTGQSDQPGISAADAHAEATRRWLPVHLDRVGGTGPFTRLTAAGVCEVGVNGFVLGSGPTWEEAFAAADTYQAPDTANPVQSIVEGE